MLLRAVTVGPPKCTRRARMTVLAAYAQHQMPHVLAFHQQIGMAMMLWSRMVCLHGMSCLAGGG